MFEPISQLFNDLQKYTKGVKFQVYNDDENDEGFNSSVGILFKLPLSKVILVDNRNEH